MRYAHKPEVERNDGESLSAYWARVQDFALKDGYAPYYVKAMAQCRATGETIEEMVLEGTPDVIRVNGFFLRRQLPIWTGKQAKLVMVPAKTTEAVA